MRKKKANESLANIKQENGLISFVFKNQVKNKSHETGIKNVFTIQENRKHIYDLRGRNLGTDASALPKGVYIIDGKKVVK